MADLSALEQQYGLPAGLLSSVQQTESGGNPNAISPKGALGAFQFLPSTAKQYGIDPLNPDQAAQGAARMYSDLLTKYDGDVPSALAAYNWGQGNVDRKGLANAPEETRNYINKVMGGIGTTQIANAAPQNAMQSALASIGNFLVPSAQAEEMPSVAQGNFAQSDLGQALGGNPAPDLSHLSDEELQKIASGGAAQAPDLSHLSDEELQKIAVGGEKKDFLQREIEDLSKRAGNATDAANAYDANFRGLPGGQGIGQTALQMMGNLGYGPANDLIKNTAISGYRMLPQGAQDYIGDKASALKDYVANSAVGQAVTPTLQAVGQSVSDYMKANPNEARTIGALGDIAAFAPMGKSAGVTGELAGGAAEKVGGAIENAGIKQAQNAKNKFVQDLVLPKETKAVLEEQVPRTTQNLLGNKIYDPTNFEKETAAVVSAIPEVKASNTVQKNFNAVQDANIAEANNLKQTLVANDVNFPRKEFGAQLNQVVQSLADNPLLTGDAQDTAQKIVAKMKQILLNNKSSASGLLQARKDLDAWVRSQKGNAAFDPAKENALSTALREVRQATNGFIAQKVPIAGVADSLRKQTLMYNAMDNMAPKAAGEAKSIPGRILQKATNSIPGKTILGKTAALAATAGVGSGLAAVAPAIALGGAAAYGAKKALFSPTTKKIVGGAIKGAGNAAKAVTPR